MRTQARPTVTPAKAAEPRAAPSAADAHAWHEAVAAVAGRMRHTDAKARGIPARPEKRAEPGGARGYPEGTDDSGAPASQVGPRSFAELTAGAEKCSLSGTAISAPAHAKASGGGDAHASAAKEAAPRRAKAAKTEAAGTEAAGTEAAGTEAAKTEAAKTEAAKTEAAKTEAAKTGPRDHDPAGHGDGAVAEADKKPGPRHSGVSNASGGRAPETKAASAPVAASAPAAAAAAAGSAAPAAAATAAGGASATSSPAPLAAASGALVSVGQADGKPAVAIPAPDGRTRLASTQAAAGIGALPLPPALPSAAASAGAAPSGAGTATAAQAGQPGLQRAAADLAGMGGGSISVTLRPPTLGTVQVQMAAGATGSTHIQLTAATHEGYAALAAAGPALVQHLAGAGIAVGSLRTAMQGGSGQGQQSHGQQSHGQPRGNGAPAGTRRAEDEGEDRILGYA